MNVDTSSQPGIIMAEKMGLVSSKMADMIFTSDPSFAVEHLFDKNHKVYSILV